MHLKIMSITVGGIGVHASEGYDVHVWSDHLMYQTQQLQEAEVVGTEERLILRGRE